MTRRERLERKAAQRLEWAASREAKADASYSGANLSEEASGIPFGQPILVGHHSERRHRRAVEKAQRAVEQSIEHGKMAAHHRSKAAGIQQTLNRTIFSDDEDAVEQLEEKLQKLESFREKNNAVNRIIRRKPKNEITPEKLEDLKKLTKIDLSKLFEPDDCGRIGIPSYVNANLSSNISTIRKRIESLKRQQAQQEVARNNGTGYVVEGNEYIKVIFAEKPPRDVINDLKSAGFSWSNGGWYGKRENLPEIEL